MSECDEERKRNKCGRDSILNSKIVHRNNNKNVTDVSDEDAMHMKDVEELNHEPHIQGK
jgi:hypothetical protein